jgi:hypothetical protein
MPNDKEKWIGQKNADQDLGREIGRDSNATKAQATHPFMSRTEPEMQRSTMARRDVVQTMRLQYRLGRIIRWGRKKKGFTRSKFAALIGVSTKELVLMEKGILGIPGFIHGKALLFLDVEVRDRTETLVLEIGLWMSEELPRRLTLH